MTITQLSNAVAVAAVPLDAFARGSNVAPQAVAAAALERARLIDAFAPVLNAAGDNTIPAALKRNAIQQSVVRDFARRVAPLTLFSTAFQNVPLQGTDVMSVPFLPLDETPSEPFAAATGYGTTGETNLETREVQIGSNASQGGRWYQKLSFTSEEIARRPFWQAEEFVRN